MRSNACVSVGTLGFIKDLIPDDIIGLISYSTVGEVFITGLFEANNLPFISVKILLIICCDLCLEFLNLYWFYGQLSN